jgi:histone H3/H4
MEPQDYSSAAINIITPVIENAVVLSGHYAKACGRSTILAKDMEYCLKYCAMHTVGDKIGSYFPEIYDSEDSGDEDEIETVDEADEEPFEPYNGSNVAMKSITDAYDAWESWVPTNPSERMLKNAIDSNECFAGARWLD